MLFRSVNSLLECYAGSHSKGLNVSLSDDDGFLPCRFLNLTIEQDTREMIWTLAWGNAVVTNVYRNSQMVDDQ